MQQHLEWDKQLRSVDSRAELDRTWVLRWVSQPTTCNELYVVDSYPLQYAWSKLEHSFESILERKLVLFIPYVLCIT